MTKDVKLCISIGLTIVAGAILIKKKIDKKRMDEFDVIIIDDRVRRAKVCNA